MSGLRDGWRGSSSLPVSPHAAHPADACALLLLPCLRACACSFRSATGEGNFELDADSKQFLVLKIWVPRLREYN